MDLFDSAPTSMDVENFILRALTMYKTSLEAVNASLPGENIYRVSINVEQVPLREIRG